MSDLVKLNKDKFSMIDNLGREVGAAIAPKFQAACCPGADPSLKANPGIDYEQNTL